MKISFRISPGRVPKRADWGWKFEGGKCRCVVDAIVRIRGYNDENEDENEDGMGIKSPFWGVYICDASG